MSHKKTLEHKQDYAEAHNKLGAAFAELGKTDDAIFNYKKALEFKPDYAEAKHMLSALKGETTNSPPRVYVENLFDTYALNFENSLVNKLEYKTPKIITEMILKKNLNTSLGSVLDLGCGTGLIGDEIKNHSSNITGIDLSKSMLEQAKVKTIYNELIHKDILEYLSTENLNFDYFISTDVFIYIGDLSKIFGSIKTRNKSKGKFVFSTEHTEKEGFFLEKSGRYSHSKKYIESLCVKFDYRLSHFEKINLRKGSKKNNNSKDKDSFFIGGLYLLDF